MLKVATTDAALVIRIQEIFYIQSYFDKTSRNMKKMFADIWGLVMMQVLTNIRGTSKPPGTLFFV